MLLLLVLLAGCLPQTDSQPTRLQGQIFGTFWLVTLPEAVAEREARRLDQGIREVLQRVDQQMSTYRADSELMQLNQHPVGEWLEVSEALFYVLEKGQEVAQASGGAFDMTMGGLVNLWSFGPEARPEEVPAADLLEARRIEAGYQQLELDAATQRVRRLSDHFVDLSGIAKGFGVDEVARWLAQQGYSNYLINIGGDLIVAGQRTPERLWTIGVEVPQFDLQQIAQHILPLSDISVATSGDYRNYFEADGRRLSHTISPFTGWPINHNLASVTVLHPENMLADAWATAIMVLGAEAGWRLAEQEGLEALLITRTEAGWESRVTSALGARLGEELSQTIEHQQ
ncbi:FAD:protein FMN transferase [Marinospirillum sp.]|uniref:FAD:protein FMN transferase n=1 Tax=Marinospirillum sp. TaxID=2183934 RepID=UPI003A852901